MIYPYRSMASSIQEPSANCWGITEGAAGMVSQVKGLAEAVGCPYVLHTSHVRQPWKSMLTNCVPLASWVFKQSEMFDADPPRLVITCGRQAVLSALYLKKRYQSRIITVHIQNPRIDPRRFDLVISPRHDEMTGPNVLQSFGAIHHITPEVLAEARRNALSREQRLPASPFVAVLLGGPSRYYVYSNSDVERFEAKLLSLVRNGTRLLILPSRRTPVALIDRFHERFSADNMVWLREGENPYLAALALATHIIVTCDSASMISEAAATGKPVYVEYMAEHRHPRRFRRLHASFEESGITRPFQAELSEWTYEVPNDTAVAGQLIRDRMEMSHVTAESA